MTRHDKRSGRNFGYGKSMTYAAKNVLRQDFAGHPATAEAHLQRFKPFPQWLRTEHGIRDAHKITVEHVRQFGEHLKQEGKAVSTVQNMLSSINVIMECWRADRVIRVSPSDIAGQRTYVRKQAPNLDREAVVRAAEQLRLSGHERAACSLLLARDFGMRRRETALADVQRLVREATTQGRINITEGTKGGRGKRVDRWVPVTTEGLETLKAAAELQGDRRNLIPADKSLKAYTKHLESVTTPRLTEQGLGTRHDLRAAYACERYHYWSGEPAPCVAGERRASKVEDRAARLMIAEELGHSRMDVAAQYVGSAR